MRRTHGSDSKGWAYCIRSHADNVIDKISQGKWEMVCKFTRELQQWMRADAEDEVRPQSHHVLLHSPALSALFADAVVVNSFLDSKRRSLLIITIVSQANTRSLSVPVRVVFVQEEEKNPLSQASVILLLLTMCQRTGCGRRSCK